MKMSLFIERLSDDLKRLGTLGGGDFEAHIARLLPTLEPILRTRLLEAFTEVANELHEELPGIKVEARMTGDDVELVVAQGEAKSQESPSELNARITLRLPEDLKARIESAANKEGISLNSWLLKASDRNSLSVTIGGRQLKGKGRS